MPVSESIEIVRPDHPKGTFRAVLFDFDGTLSLIRRNWQDVMIPMMVDVLAATPAAESREAIEQVVKEFVVRHTGRQTIYQMIELADQVRRRGGTPLEPVEYKHAYHERLMPQVAARVAALRSGRTRPDDLLVAGSRDLLAALENRGLLLYLASGTDEAYVREEAAVLGIDAWFGPRIYGAQDDYKKFSKAIVVDRILHESGITGAGLVVIGDGYVEIQEAKRVAALAIGVASHEDGRPGYNPWKRTRLIEAGADLVIADFRQLDTLLTALS